MVLNVELSRRQLDVTSLVQERGLARDMHLGVVRREMVLKATRPDEITRERCRRGVDGV